MPTRLASSAAVLWAFLSALAVAEAPKTKFGGEWPSLVKCLVFSEETGAWGWDRALNSTKTEDGKGEIRLEALSIVFRKDGEFTLGWNESESVVNEFWRNKQVGDRRMAKFSGRWRLAYRAATVQERTAVGADKNAAFDAWFLDLIFMGNQLPEAYAEYPALKGTKINGRMLLVLNEFIPYKKTAKASPVSTTPARLLWIVLEDELDMWLMPSEVATNRLLIMRHR